MPTNTPPCPSCDGQMKALVCTVAHKDVLTTCQYVNSVEAHATLCALVERGRQATDEIRMSCYERDHAIKSANQSIRERDAAREVLADAREVALLSKVDIELALDAIRYYHERGRDCIVQPCSALVADINRALERVCGLAAMGRNE